MEDRKSIQVSLNGAITLRYALFAILYLFFSGTSGEFFDNYCRKPPYPGRGVLQKRNTECVVTFKFRTKTQEEAREYCESNAPYYVNEFKNGYPTKCFYARPLIQCNDDEAALEDRCLSVRGYGTFDKHSDACGKKTLHYLNSDFEKNWAAVIFAGQGEIWTSVSDEEAFRIVDLKRRKIRGTNETTEEDERGIKLIGRSSITGKYKKGDLVYGNRKERHPFLCSRTAAFYARGIDNLVNNAKQLGFSMKTAKDASGQNRPFIVFENVFAVEATKFDANYKSFDNVCDVFPNGYMASRFDFLDHNEYKKVITNGRWSLYRVKVARHKSATFEPKGCQRDSEAYKMLRKRFNFITEDGKLASIKENHWESSYPMNMCADTPRITAVMAADGYRDMSAIARLPIICTFGNPQNLPTRSDDDVCSKLAHFNQRTGSCECNDPKSDAKYEEPEKYKDVPSGMICMSCTSYEIKRTVIFVLDGSGSISDSGWDQEKQFVASAVTYLRGARSAVIEIGCPSRVLLSVGLHSAGTIRSSIGSPERGGTSMPTAFQLADDIISKEYSTEKSVIILSDGENWCNGNDYFYLPEKWRSNGVKIMYVVVDHAISSEILRVAGSMENIKNAGSVMNVADKEILQNVLRRLCQAID